MGAVTNSFTNKENKSNDELKVLPVIGTKYLGQAEQMAKIVSVGLEQENYSVMNKKLLTLDPKDNDKESYVFEHPQIGMNVLAVVICAFFSSIFLYVMFIGGGTAILSAEYLIFGLIALCVSLVLFIFNIFLVTKIVSTIKYKKRFDVYISLLRFRSIEILEDLALYANKEEALVIKDLKKGIKLKFIPQGHFSKENIVFMVSDDIYDRYMQKQAVYDRYFKKHIEERNRMRERTEEMNHIMDMGNKYIEKIHDSNTIIKDKSVSRKLEQMEKIVSMIFHEVDANPTQTHSLGLFLNYYLPTTEKLLDAYIKIGEKQITGKSLNNTKKEIENSLETIINAYETILEKFYAANEMDITSDIAAMEIMMKQEGLTD